MKKKDVKGIYDGSIFFKRAEETKRKRVRDAHQQNETSPPGLVAKAKELLEYHLSFCRPGQIWHLYPSLPDNKQDTESP